VSDAKDRDAPADGRLAEATALGLGSSWREACRTFEPSLSGFPKNKLLFFYPVHLGALEDHKEQPGPGDGEKVYARLG